MSKARKKRLLRRYVKSTNQKGINYFEKSFEVERSEKMPQIEWLDQYSVGVESIDNQHKELFARINKLLDACSQGEGKKVLPEVLDFLGDYVVFHFSTEEKYMKEYLYPHYTAHKNEHDNFVETYKKFREEIEKEGAGVAAVIKTNRLVVDWLKNHILGTDRKLGAFLKEKMQTK